MFVLLWVDSNDGNESWWRTNGNKMFTFSATTAPSSGEGGCAPLLSQVFCDLQHKAEIKRRRGTVVAMTRKIHEENWFNTNCVRSFKLFWVGRCVYCASPLPRIIICARISTLSILESMTKIRWAQIDLVLSWKQLLTRLLFFISDQYTLSSVVWISRHLWSQFLSNKYDKNEGSTSMTNEWLRHCLDCRVCISLSVPVSVS